MAAIHQLLLAGGDSGSTENGFQFWLDGEPMADVGDESMTFWMDGEPNLTEEE
jgi:hypothetical protein